MTTSMIIIEPFQHYEVLHSLLRMVIASRRSATVITNQFCKNHIKLDQSNSITWHVSPKTEEAILKQKTLLGQEVKIIFTTINPNSIFWKWKNLNNHISAYIHNGHSFFNLDSYRITSLSYKTKHWSYTLRGDYHQQRNILRQLTRILVPDEEIKKHLKARIKPKDQQKIKRLPFAFPEFPIQIHHHELIQITIPGTISNQLRDYQTIIDCLEKVDQAIKVSVRLTLLGRLKEVAIRAAFKKTSLKNIEVEIFPDYIAPDSFEERMRETDFLLLPIREKVIYKAHYEHRGKSSVSGNINDLTRYALPAILPDFYPLDSKLEKITDRYSDVDNLSKILINWISNRRFNHLKKEITDILNEYQKATLKDFIEYLNLYFK